MNILQLTNKMPYPPNDGGSIATLNMSKSFSELGHKVSILAMNTPKHSFNIEDIPEELSSKIFFESIDVETDINKKDALLNLFFSNLPYNAVRFISDKYTNKLISVLKSEDFDIVQLEGIYLAPYIKIIKKHSNALISLRSHNIEHEIWKRVASNETNPVKKKYTNILSSRIKNFEKKYLNHYDLLVPITSRDLNVLNKMGNKKPSHVSMTGINFKSLIKDKSNINYPSLFFIGALDWAPNQEGLQWFFKNVWKRVNEKFPDLKIYITGRNAPEKFIRIFEKKNVEYIGSVDDAYKFMNSNSIMIAPLFSGSGMRIKIIEGMALGKAIITTKIGTEGIETTNYENIIIAENEMEFVKAIEELVTNERLFNSISQKAMSFIQDKFNNNTITSELLDFYQFQIDNII
jgi:glycosyltransferase involved in cell wall biosynthesis